MLVILLVVSCNFRTEKFPLEQRGNPTGHALQAFSESVYAYTRRHCVGCHGSNQHPRFAQEDLSAAYLLSSRYANFDHIPNSTFIYRTQNGHCGPSCLTDGTAMQSAIEYWKNGELNEIQSRPSKLILTEKQYLPADLPFENEYLSLRWALAGGEIEIEVQRFGRSSYRFRKPRIRNTISGLSVSNLHVLINDRDAPSYFEITQNLDPDSQPVLSAKTLIVATGEKTRDEIQLGLETLSPQAAVGCHNSEYFVNKIVPLLTRCWRCHNDNASLAFQLFPMNGDADTLCRQCRQRTDKNEPFDSALIAYPYRKAGGHPVKDLTADEATQIRDWLIAE